MPTRFGVRNVGVRDGRRLRKVVGTVWHDDRYGGHYWEVLSCGHEGRSIGLHDTRRATQRWCDECKAEGRPQREPEPPNPDPPAEDAETSSRGPSGHSQP